MLIIIVIVIVVIVISIINISGCKIAELDVEGTSCRLFALSPSDVDIMEDVSDEQVFEGVPLVDAASDIVTIVLPGTPSSIFCLPSFIVPMTYDIPYVRRVRACIVVPSVIILYVCMYTTKCIRVPERHLGMVLQVKRRSAHLAHCLES